MRASDYLADDARGPKCARCGGGSRIYTGKDGMKWIPCPDCWRGPVAAATTA